MRVALDQPLKGERAKDHCSRNMHPGCRSYRRRERRSTPARELGELGLYSCRSGSRTRPQSAPSSLQSNHEQAFHPIFDPRGRSSRRVRELGTGPALGPKNGAPTGGAPASLPPTTPSTPPCRQAHKAVTTCRDNADSTSMSLLVSILRCKTRWVLELMFEHYPPEW